MTRKVKRHVILAGYFALLFTINKVTKTHVISPLAELYPPLSGEIGGLCTVEAVIEALMVGVWKRHYYFTCTLRRLKLKIKR